MLNIREYINLVLDKKKMTRADFCKKINQIEEKLGEKKTTTQNITNYLNGTDDKHNIGYKMALKMEKALDLPDDTLLKMVKNPLTPDVAKDFDIMKKKVRNL
jgi:transcriptional regulator with XRE-family HTH domain